MNIDSDKQGEITILHLTGDFISEPDQLAFQDKVRALVRDGEKHVVVDMNGVHYINSCGIGSLVGALTTLRRSGGEIRIAAVRNEVQSVFVTTKLETIFHFHHSVNEAVSASV